MPRSIQEILDRGPTGSTTRVESFCRRLWRSTSTVVIHDDSPPGSPDVATTVDDGSILATIAAIASGDELHPTSVTHSRNDTPRQRRADARRHDSSTTD